MKNRSGVVLVILLALSAGACASGGGAAEDPNPSAGAANPTAREFPAGTEPARNMWTRSAQIYLDQAENADAADEKAAEYTQGLAQARLSIQNQPNNPLGYYQAGIALIGLEQYGEAGRMLDRAEELYPRYVLETGPRRQNAWITLYNAAVQALQANDDELAVQKMLLADQIFQGRPEARTNLAVIYTNRGDYAGAIEWYEKTLETLRGEEVQYMTRQVQEDWAAKESDVIFNMAQVYNRMGRRADAITLYREYIADHPDDSAVKVQLALALSAEGQEAEAAAMFAEVLNMEGLSDEEYYRIGIGLFNAQRFDDAATAFERAVAANPYFRDATFNLSQALLAQANAQRASGATATELSALYERLVGVSESLRAIDPNSRMASLVLASSYRSLADITTGAASTAWRNRLLGLLEELEAQPFDVTNVALAAGNPGRVVLTGAVENLNLAAGAPIALRVSLVGPSGSALSTQDVTVQAPARGESTSFRVEFQVSGEIAGWRYERIQ